MQLLVIRHAIAEEREAFAVGGQPDAERPLTAYGRRRMKRNAKGLLRVVKSPDAIATSPFARAAETAHIVADAFRVNRIEVLEALTPEHPPRDLVPWLATHAGDAVVAVVGHEPHLGILVTWFLGGREESHVELKKGGACLLELADSLEPGKALLMWLLTPSQLRAIGD
jgi:phosphohistidine phosphatase